MLQRFDYLRFAKTEMAGARFRLCLSGVPDAPIGQVPADVLLVPALARWRALVARRYGVPADHAAFALGTSGAVFLAVAAAASLDESGGPVAVEDPAYGCFETAAALAGREVVRVPRRVEARYALDLEAIDRAFQGGARLLCVTDLHNPTGVRLQDREVQALRDVARRHDAWVLVDEVYRDFLPGAVGTAYRPGERLLTCGSLTKCYGLGGVRAGWIFGPPAALERVECVEEITYGVPPAPVVELAAQGMERADELLARGRALAAEARPVMDEWIASTPRVSWVRPDAGLTGLVRIDGLADSRAFASRLRRELDVQVVPGSFFGAEGHIRVSFGLPPAALREALDVLALGIPPLVA